MASQYYHWQDCRYETGIRVEALAADQAPEMAASRSELWATVWPSGSEALALTAGRENCQAICTVWMQRRSLKRALSLPVAVGKRSIDIDVNLNLPTGPCSQAAGPVPRQGHFANLRNFDATHKNWRYNI